MSSKVIAFANQKGGVGKTTSCINVAASLQNLGKKVLLIDLDPQGNATMGSGVDKNNLTVTVSELLQHKATVNEVLIAKTPALYALLPANGDLTEAEVELLRANKQERVLKNIIKPLLTKYDFIFLDCPPSLNMLTLNAMVAANSVIIPMQCEYYALEGLSSLLATIEQLRDSLNKDLKIEGLVRTMYDPRNRLSTEVSAELISHFGSKVYQTVIPRNVRVAEAPSHGLPILLYDKASRGAQAYHALAKEILKANKIKVLAAVAV